jgi:lipopolysaccharide export system protein LptC
MDNQLKKLYQLKKRYQLKKLYQLKKRMGSISEKITLGFSVLLLVSQVVVVILLIGSADIHSDINFDGARRNNELLAYDGATKKWINKNASEVGLEELGHSHLLSDITDLNSTTNLDEGTNLYYRNSRVSANYSVTANTAKISADGSIATHSDVEVKLVTENELLAWDTTEGKWVNKTAAEAGLEEVGHSHLLADITNLNTTDELLEGTTNVYYTNPRVSANYSVTANTAKISADGSITTHSDVKVSSVTENELLAWDVAEGKWINQTAAEAGLEELGHSHVLQDITDIEVVQRNLFTQTTIVPTIDQGAGNFRFFTGSGVGSRNIPANSLKLGSKLTVRIAGLARKANVFYLFKLRFLNFTSEFLQTETFQNINLEAYDLTIDIVVKGVGTAAPMAISGLFSAGGDNVAFNNTTTTIDTTIVNNLNFEWLTDFTFELGSSSCTIDQTR